ncbi:MAG: sorting protein [Rhizobacter sp.]|nr:sorting protein [Rhizobacter sp.]
MKTTPTLKLSAMAACTLMLLGSHLAAHAASNWTQVGADVFGLPDGIYRSQGMTTDGTNVYFSWQFGLEKTDAHYNEIARNSSLSLSTGTITSGIDPSLSAQGFDHIGDIDYANGIIYASLDNSQTNPSYSQPAVALYDANTLKYTGQSFTLSGPDGTHDIASWIAVNATAGLAYGMAYNDATEMAVYNLSDFSFVKYIQLSQSLDSVQGGKIFGDWMYMAADDSSRSVYRTSLIDGTVEDLFSVKQPYDQEVEGLSVTAGADGSAVVNVLVVNDPKNTGNALDENVTLYHYDSVSAVPEPQTYALMLGGLAMLGFVGKRRRPTSGSARS